MGFDDILLACQGLSERELETVLEWCSELQAKIVPLKDDDLYRWYLVFSSSLRDEHIPAIPFQTAIKKQTKTLRSSFGHITQLAETWKIPYHLRPTWWYLSADLLLKEAKRLKIPLTTHRILGLVNRLPALFDQSFPNYIKNHVVNLALSREIQHGHR